ncbi:hypothetical protein HBH64_231060 [Parastagonospora nodorum]|nr:hypothetical protein HBI13_232810 [Parastagonospora nodorum]KAH4285209.1 hypothetical protein HBI02_234400 [Parastagonospora nodorum]KAH4286783.1 hypothetical protein HBI01_236010 [Parastagonospora nodorum]KAH4401237.1 hypothetical protein HBH92_226200 [Parastagonospora nodorum]KAH4473871.1 hypothetical protein HBH88_237590 [Parastagonospora nodorum]
MGDYPAIAAPAAYALRTTPSPGARDGDICPPIASTSYHPSLGGCTIRNTRHSRHEPLSPNVYIGRGPSRHHSHRSFRDDDFIVTPSRAESASHSRSLQAKENVANLATKRSLALRISRTGTRFRPLLEQVLTWTETYTPRPASV